MTTHVTALDRTVQQTQEWVRDIASRLGTDDPELGSELDVGEVDEVRDAMPAEVRALWPSASL